MEEILKKELRKDERFQLALQHIPEEQHEVFERVVLQMAKQFPTDILQKYAEAKYKVSTGEK